MNYTFVLFEEPDISQHNIMNTLLSLKAFALAFILSIGKWIDITPATVSFTYDSSGNRTSRYLSNAGSSNVSPFSLNEMSESDELLVVSSLSDAAVTSSSMELITSLWSNPSTMQLHNKYKFSNESWS